MEVERTLEQLNLLDELRDTSEDDLIERYSRTNSGYTRFIEELYSLSCSRICFIFDSFNKIRAVVEEGKKECLSRGVLSSQVLDESDSISNRLKAREAARYDQTDSFCSSIGNTGCDTRGLIKRMIKAGAHYYECSEESTENLDLILRNPRLLNGNTGIVTLCNNPDFLYFANCVILSSDKTDDNFIKDVENIMWHSSKRYPKEPNRDLSVKERIVETIDNFIERRRYSRLVQHTRKTIYQYYERRNKQESKIKEK